MGVLETFERFLTPGLIVVVGVALWTQLNGRMDQLSGRIDRLSNSIVSMDRRLARVEGQLSVLVRPVDPPSE